MSRDMTPIVQQLRARGMRVTAARHGVLEWLADNPHATVEQVHEGVRQRLGSISKQAVYDVLNACLEANLVQQIKPAGHPARFERRTGDNHHHLVCRRCGRIEDVDCAVGVRPCLDPDHDHGFEIDEAEVMYWGICGVCRTADTASTDDDQSRR
ncbi:MULTISPECIES: Fur family transcriptional regulator [unclassified Salinisphaera]|uniref:Fur family transcriptional regulator n=1 Tax=unclassified Salinisphaera TaxID=2649847 RepID=UPI00333E4573